MKDDLVYVQHMVAAAKQLSEYAAGRSRPDLDREPLLRDGFIRQLQVIGEAASRLSDVFRREHREVPWLDIVGMRHRLIHGYFKVNLDLAWETAVRDVPALLRILLPLLDQE
jgi:uncharacterized protein with HEPN domain